MRHTPIAGMILGKLSVIVEEFDDDQPPFSISAPARQRVPFVFNSPHSGRVYPPSFLADSKLDADQIRGSEDFYVEALFEDVVAIGAPLMQAHFPRAFVDVNREPYELDQKLFDEKIPPFSNRHSVRVACGLGTIARVVAESREIYHRPPSLDEAMGRIDTFYRPYHAALRRLLARTHVKFGYSVLVDCHSMPSTMIKKKGRTGPDIIIGDRYGKSCAPELGQAVCEIFQDLGMNISRNKPYAGGFITEHYGRPLRGLHAVQVEINRGLYMDEKQLTLTSGFDEVRDIIGRFTKALCSIPDITFYPEQQAAE